MTAADRPFPAPANSEISDELKSGTELLQGQYTIERFLGSGGFALTYLARDSLERPVVIKECFPSSLCVRSNKSVCARSRASQDELRNIVRLFFREAQRMARLRHPNIVGVHQVFEDNSTAYMALDYIDGPDLLNLIEDENHLIDQEQVRTILAKLLDAIAYVHDQNLLHRDISPDNILLDKLDTPVLIDFGAAREQATRASRILSALQVVKDGYSPQEFYVAGAKQGPTGDIYAIGATFYHLLTGNPPPNSQIRLSAIAAKEPDPYRPLLGNFEGYDRAFLGAIDKALNVFPKERHQTAHEWIYCLDERKRQAAALMRARQDTEIEQAVSKLVIETNQAVFSAREQEAEQRQPTETAEKKSRKPFFPWLLDDDWVNREKKAALAQPAAPKAPRPDRPKRPRPVRSVPVPPRPPQTAIPAPQAPSQRQNGLLSGLGNAFKFRFRSGDAPAPHHGERTPK